MYELKRNIMYEEFEQQTNSVVHLLLVLVLGIILHLLSSNTMPIVPYNENDSKQEYILLLFMSLYYLYWKLFCELKFMFAL